VISLSIGTSVINKKRNLTDYQRARFVKPKITVKIDDQGEIFTIQTPYDSNYIEQFLELVPERDRNWFESKLDRKAKYWIVRKKWLKKVRELSSNYFVDINNLPQQLAKFKDKEFKTHTLYKIPTGAPDPTNTVIPYGDPSDESMKQLLTRLASLAPDGRHEQYKASSEARRWWGAPYRSLYGPPFTTILLPKKGYYFPSIGDRTSSRDIFFSAYQRHKDIHATPLKLKKLRMSAAFMYIFNSPRQEDIVKLTDNEILALNKEFQFRIKKATDLGVLKNIDIIVRDMDLKNPKYSAKMLKTVYKLAT
jgi:hypothetical protein